MCCHTSTEIPNAAPSESSTVPTMASEATNARVMIIITTKISVTEAIPTINRSYRAPD